MAHVVAFLLIAGVAVAAGLAVAFVLARGYVRRHWRLVRGHPVTRGVLAVWALVSAARERMAQTTPSELSRGSAARVRRRMWVAVEDAESAVAHATEHDAPVADLPSVCRSLRVVADELDALLRLERRLPAGTARSSDVRRQVAEVIDAALTCRHQRCGREATPPRRRCGRWCATRCDEIEIVSAGLAHMRSVARPS